MRTSNSLLSKSHDISAFNPWDPLRTCSKPCYFDLILTILDPFEGPGEAVARPCTSCLWLEDLFRASQTHARDLKFLVILTTFPIEKSIFVILPIRVSENAILTLFWALLSQAPPLPNFWPWPKCAYLGPLPWMDLWGTLRDPKFDPNLTILDPFEGPGGRLWLDPCTSCLWAGGTCSEPLKPMPGTSNFGHFDHFSYWKVNFCHFAYQGSVKMPFWPYFDPILSPPEPKTGFLAQGQNVPILDPLSWRDLGGTLGWRDPRASQNWDLKFWLIWTLFWGSWRRLRLGPLHWRDPQGAAFGWRTCSEPHKPMPGTSNFGHFDHFWPHFGSKNKGSVG